VKKTNKSKLFSPTWQLKQRENYKKTTTFQADVSKNHHFTKKFQKTTTLPLTRNKKH
jgi:hypothetical protein